MAFWIPLGARSRFECQTRLIQTLEPACEIPETERHDHPHPRFKLISFNIEGRRVQQHPIRLLFPFFSHPLSAGWPCLLFETNQALRG